MKEVSAAPKEECPSTESQLVITMAEPEAAHLMHKMEACSNMVVADIIGYRAGGRLIWGAREVARAAQQDDAMSGLPGLA